MNNKRNFKTITEAVDFHLGENPERIAFEVFQHDVVTYRQLSEEIKRFKEFAIENEIETDRRIAIFTKNIRNHVILELCIFEYCTLCAINDDLEKEQVAFMLDLLKVDHVITDELDRRIDDLLTEKNIGVIRIAPGHGTDTTLSYQVVKKSLTPPHRIKHGHRIGRLATTSGTTSVPKVVPVPYEEKVQKYIFDTDYYRLNETAVTMEYRKPFINLVGTSLIAGSMVYIIDGFRHNEVVELINTKSLYWLYLPPAVILSLANYIESNGLSITSGTLVFIRSGGAPLDQSSRDRIERIFKARLVNTYGMTEALGGIASSYNAPKGPKDGSPGVALDLDVKTIDGEICIKGPTVFKGYENEDVPRADYFTEDDWFRTGDAGYIDDDGYIFITGRIKEMINKGGEKVSPYEVEKLVMEKCNVKEAYAFPYPNEIGSENVGLVITHADGKNLHLNDIRKRLSGNISAYKMPTLLFKVDEIPIARSGKVQRKKLFEAIAASDPRSFEKEELADNREVDADERKSPVERKLGALWCKLLNVDSLSTSDDFFERGGDSLNAAIALSEIEDIYGVQIPISTFFESGTVAAIARIIEQKGIHYRYDFIFPIKETGSDEPLFCVHSGDGEAVTYHSIGKYIHRNTPVYGIRFNNKSDWHHPVTFKEISRKYADEIEIKQPEGRIHLLGYCYGGVLALAIAQELKDRGRTIENIVMLDAFEPVVTGGKRASSAGGFFKKTSKRWKNSMSSLHNQPLNEIPSMVIKKAKTATMTIVDKGRYPLYVSSSKLNHKPLIMMSGKKAPLRYASKSYRQAYYDDTVYYFRANLDVVQNKNRVKSWASIVKELIVVDMNTYHVEIGSEKNMKFIAEQINRIRADKNA
jgi:acyl-CoA synthetase (AMP-forming)/AMP-acid ligase II/thioesterase domain-containing protein/acyl carrier protein